MTTRRKVLNIILGGLALFFVFTIWYTQRYGMDKIAEFEINDARLDSRILIASQGSEYKNTLVADIISSFNYDSIYIKVIDVIDLKKENGADWDALVILHTWEIGVPPETVSNFIDQVVDRNKLIVVATSGSGEEQIDGVDGISSASLLGEIPDQRQLLVNRIYGLLKAKSEKDITSILK